MQQLSFEFPCPGGHAVAIELLCREPPEAQAGKTLTWQVAEDREHAQDRRQAVGSSEAMAEGGPPAPALGASAAPAPDLIGLDIWPASIALCRYVAAHPQLVASPGQHVLELGAGRCLPSGMAWLRASCCPCPAP